MLTEDLSMINRAFRLRVSDNGVSIYCPDIICSWNGTCSTNNTTNCRNCPNCPGCQQVPVYCNQCPYCNGCPRANNNTGSGFGGGRGGSLFILGAGAPETEDDN